MPFLLLSMVFFISQIFSSMHSLLITCTLKYCTQGVVMFQRSVTEQHFHSFYSYMGNLTLFWIIPHVLQSVALPWSKSLYAVTFMPWLRVAHQSVAQGKNYYFRQLFVRWIIRKLLTIMTWINDKESKAGRTCNVNLLLSRFFCRWVATRFLASLYSKWSPTRRMVGFCSISWVSSISILFPSTDERC